jgi:hypothetical protein
VGIAGRFSLLWNTEEPPEDATADAVHERLGSPEGKTADGAGGVFAYSGEGSQTGFASWDVATSCHCGS